MKYPFFLCLGFLLASLATTTAQIAFRHVTTATNTNGHITTLDHQQLNGNPNAMVFIMPNYNTNGADPSGADYQQNAGVWYNGSRWTIFNQNTKALMPMNLTFNVLIAPAGSTNYFTISCTAASKTGLAPNGMVIDHPATNNKPDALLLVTQNWAGTYNDNSPIVSYTNGKWYISNNKYLLTPEISAKTTLPVGARFNVMVVENNTVSGFSNARAFMHTTTADNIIPSGSSITFFDQSFLNSNTNAMIWATPNWGWSPGRNAGQTSGPYNDSPIKAWYDHPTDPWNYKNGYWSIYNSDGTILKPGTKFNIVTMNIGGNTPQPTRDLTGFYRGDNGNCGQAYIRQIGNNVYWFGEHPDGSFGHVFSGTINGNTLTGNLWDVPKGTLMNKGNCVYNISADGNTLTLTGGTIGCNVLAKTTMPTTLPASKPMQAGSGALTGVWDCNDGAATYVREDGNDFIFFSEAKNNGTQPGFANLYIGKRNGSTITGDWVDVPKGTHLGSGKMTLRVESDTRIVRSDNGNGYGGGVWTRRAPDITGTWQLSSGDRTEFIQDGQNVYSIYNNANFKHFFSGKYITSNRIEGQVIRTDLNNNCRTIFSVNYTLEGNSLRETWRANDGNCGIAQGQTGSSILSPTTSPSNRPMNELPEGLFNNINDVTGSWVDSDGGSSDWYQDDKNVYFIYNNTGFKHFFQGTKSGTLIKGNLIRIDKNTSCRTVFNQTISVIRNNSMAYIWTCNDGACDVTRGQQGSGTLSRLKKPLIDNLGDILPNAQKTVATVYTDCGFAGQSYRLQTGPVVVQDDVTFKLSELNIPSNSISSIKLSKGYSATLYFANGGGSADILVNEDCFDLYKLTNIESIRVFKDARLKGYADMHTHPMSHLGFGKRLMHGVPDLGSLIPAGTRYKGFNLVEKECNTSDERATTIEQALGTCNATHGGWGAENDCGNYIRAIVISKAFDGDFVHNVSHDPFNGGNVHGDHRHEGIETSPSFMYWPHQTSVTHQQMWWEWLKRTYDGGLRVMVALTVNSELFAEIIDGDGPKDDKASADLQLDEIITFVGRHDDFMEIARTPADLRRIVGANKMAVLLGMEVDNIGNFHKPDVKCDEIAVRAEIKRLHEKGVRYIFPIHLTDNKFGGAAVYEDLFNYVNRYSTGSLFSVEQSADATINFRLGNGLDGAGNLGIKAALDRASGIPFPPAFDFFKCPVPTLGCWDKFKFVQGLLAPDPRYATYTRITQGHVNRTGLTSLGEFAIREMMKLGMVIDVDHMSAKAINRSLSIAESVNGGYPINMGHNGIRIGAGAERSASIEMVKRVSALGGMFGVGTADTNPSDFVKNYNVAWYVMGSRNTAIGTDVNGFEPLPKASPNLNSNDFYRGLEKCKTGNRTWDYTKEGVAHYGLMTEFLRDARLQQNGYEMVNSLMLSAEYFAQMWEKCERQKTQIR